ncbi:MAG: glucosamine-6-phosphate synthase, partial [Actinobacteria bacterium]|nr:glucosamine-6-phosphate synthase [Actinomycetota bacterium]
MCGIIAVVRRPSTRATPTSQAVLDLVAGQAALFVSGPDATDTIAGVGARLAEADALLRGVPGLRLLLAEPSLGPALVHHCDALLAAVEQEEQRLEQDGTLLTSQIEARNQALIAVRDGVWAITRDRLRAAEVVSHLNGGAMQTGSLEAFLSIHQALSAIDRLEVRGRDSAGLHVLVHDHALDLDDPVIAAEIARRSGDPNFGTGSVRVV